MNHGDETVAAPGTNAARLDFANLAAVYGADELHRLAALFRAGQWPQADLLEAKSSKAALYDRMKRRGVTRQRAARLGIIVARITEAPAAAGPGAVLSRPSLVEAPSPLVEWSTRSDRFRDTLTRSTLGVPVAPTTHAPGKLEPWMVADLPLLLGHARADLQAWRLGDGALVWWGRAWHLGYVHEIGGVGDGPTLRLRVRLPGHDSDLWVLEDEWASRLRPVASSAAGFGRLAKGHCGRAGDLVAVDLIEGCEAGFWVGARRPVGVVTKASLERDAVEVELCCLAVTERVVVPNGVCRRVSPPEHAAAVAHVAAVRSEARRLLDALLAGATAEAAGTDADAEAAAAPALGRSPASVLGSRVWHGARVISDHRLLVSVLRRNGALPGATSAATMAEAPQWHVRLFDPAARDWHLLAVPTDKLAAAALAAGVGGASGAWVGAWGECDETAAAEVGAEVSKHLRARDGVMEWRDEWQATDPPNDPPTIAPNDPPSKVPSAAQPLPAAFPSTHGAELQRVKGVRLRGVACEVVLLRGGGGQEPSDGCRLAVVSSGGGSVRDVLVLGRSDWQWLRPRGLNAGALPGLRWCSRKQRKALVKGLVARLDTFEGCACLRLPHRTVYPLGFAPFRANPPPSGERAWALRALPPARSLVWRAGVLLEAPAVEAPAVEELAIEGRWAVSVRVEGEALRVVALQAKQTLRLSLGPAAWAAWGLGPLPWLARDQKEFMARRLVAVLRLQAAPSAAGRVCRLCLAADMAPVLGRCGRVAVADGGAALLLTANTVDRADQQGAGVTTTVVVAARDLVACCPALRADPFARPSTWDVACGLGPVRFPLASRRRRPGYSAAALAADDADCAAAWEEVRLASSLRDLEPPQRRALARRVALSVQGAVGGAAGPLSRPPAMPSATSELSATLLEVRRDAEGVVLRVALRPPVPLWPAGSALDACTLVLHASSTVVTVAVAARGLLQRVRLDETGAAEALLAAVQEGTDPEATLQRLRASGEVQNLAVALQRQAGRQAAGEPRQGSALFPPRPVPVRLHSAFATFARTPPLQLTIFDTGRGVLVEAQVRAGGYEQITLEETRAAVASPHGEAQGGGGAQGALEEQQRLLEAAATSAAALPPPRASLANMVPGSAAVVARYEVPLAEVGFREPLLMTSSELERLMLGCVTKPKWRERRRGARRCDFLSLTLEAALFGHKPPDEGAPGLAHWAAPFRGGSALIGTVTKVHPDGAVDVSVTGGLAGLRRVPRADVRCPLRPGRHLTTFASPRDFDTLNSNAAALGPATDLAGLRVGAAVVVRGRRALASQGSTARLMHDRGADAYVAAVSGDGYAAAAATGGALGTLPEHLRLLLDFSTDGDASTAPPAPPAEIESEVEEAPEEASAGWGDDGSYAVHASSSVAGDGSASSQSLARTIEQARQAVLPPQDEEDDAYLDLLDRRQRMAEATDAFYRRQAKLLEEEGDERFARGEALERSQLQPTELPDEWQDDEVAAAMAAAHDVINRGETETETRRRVLNARNCFLEAAALYKESLEKWKDPRLHGRLARTLLRTKQYAEAAAAADRALEAFPHSARLHFLQGQALLSLKRPRNAFRSFEKAKQFGKKVKGGLDKKLVDKYLRLAVTARRGFVPFDDLVGALVPEADDPALRDVDQRLNVYNMYDSVPALVAPARGPAFAGGNPSQLVNPIALRIRHQGRRVPSKRRKHTSVVAVLENASVAEEEESSDDESAAAGRPPVLAVEEDDGGEGDDGVLFEVEVATGDGRVLELTVFKEQHVGDAIEAFLKRHAGVLTPKQAARLKRDLVSRAHDGHAGE